MGYIFIVYGARSLAVIDSPMSHATDKMHPGFFLRLCWVAVSRTAIKHLDEDSH